MPTTTQKPASTKPLCVVSIDHQCFLLKMEDGLKLVTLLQSAVLVERRFESRDDSYTPEERQHRVELAMVRASQIVPAAPQRKRGPDEQLLLGSDA